MSERTFSGARILVVGGAGFVGSNLVRGVLEHDPAEVLVVDNLLSAERENLPDDGRIRFVEASINDVAITEQDRRLSGPRVQDEDDIPVR